MKNKAFDIFQYADYTEPNLPNSYLAKQLFDWDEISDEALETLVENKLEYLEYLISISPKKLTLRPLKDWDTFACWLWEEIDNYIPWYMNGNYSIKKIPEELFEPKYLYYSLSMMLQIDDQLLREVQWHEMQHALSSDFKDVVRCNRIAYQKQLPATPIHWFFNFVEDFYINSIRAKTNAVRKNGIKMLYKHISARFCTWVLSAQHLPRIKQFEIAVVYHYLNNYFPNDYNVKVDVTDEIKIHLENIKPHLQEIADINMDNQKRIWIKNITFWPILEELLRKDIDDQAKLIKYLEELKKLIKSKSDKSKKNNKSDKKPWSRQSEPWWNSILDDLLDALDDIPNNKNLTPIEKKWAQHRVDAERKNSTPQEKQPYIDRAKKKIDNDGLKEVKKSMPQFDWDTDDKWNITPSSKKSKDKEPWSPKPWSKIPDDNLQKRIEDMIKQFHKDKKAADDIAWAIKDLDYKDWKKIEEQEKKAWNIKTSKNRKAAQEMIENRKKMLIEKRKRFIEEIQEQWFSEDQEYDYMVYHAIEEKIAPLVEEFIQDLMNDIPKLKDITLEGDYFSGKIYNIISAWRKIKMWHYDVYGREEEENSVHVQLWMSLSIDVSSSMSDVALQVLTFAIFMSLFCERLWIPFYINTFWSKVTSIKSFDDQYYSNKWEISRMLTHLQSRTDIAAWLEDILEKGDDFFVKNRDILLMPIIITDGQPNKWKDWDELKEVAERFDGNDILVWLWLQDFEKEYFSEIFSSEWKLFLDNAWDIMTKWKERLRDYFISMQWKIFKQK